MVSAAPQSTSSMQPRKAGSGVQPGKSNGVPNTERQPAVVAHATSSRPSQAVPPVVPVVVTPVVGSGSVVPVSPLVEPVPPLASVAEASVPLLPEVVDVLSGPEVEVPLALSFGSLGSPMIMQADRLRRIEA